MRHSIACSVQVLSRDSVTVNVDAVVYYRVVNAVLAVRLKRFEMILLQITKVENATDSTHLLAATTLRNILGTMTLAEMLSERASIAHTMQVRQQRLTIGLILCVFTT